MGRKYTSVEALVKSTIKDEKIKQDVLEDASRRTLSKLLTLIRCEHGVTQKHLAKIRCTQSRISKIERSFDGEIKVKDLLDYGKALNLQLGMG